MRRLIGPPLRRPKVWGELLVVVWLCWVYDWVANLGLLRLGAARAHARGALHLEQVLHIDPEASLDHWLVGHHTLAVLVSNYYDNAHFVVTFGIVAWLWWRHPVQYRPLRTGLVLANVIAIVVFWVYPMAPPRILDPRRFADVVASTHAFGSWHTGSLASAADQLAAMPSLHIAWAVWSALALWRVFRYRRLAHLAWLYPALTALAVLATGNHFVLDVLGGAATIVVAMLVADRWQGWWTTRLANRAVARRSRPAATSPAPAATSPASAGPEPPQRQPDQPGSTSSIRFPKQSSIWPRRTPGPSSDQRSSTPAAASRSSNSSKGATTSAG
ncbi:MAG: phosphatase PAP2 family protein [Acidimicrobiales bacterium]